MALIAEFQQLLKDLLPSFQTYQTDLRLIGPVLE
jgi:hypothetical protein